MRFSESNEILSNRFSKIGIKLDLKTLDPKLKVYFWKESDLKRCFNVSKILKFYRSIIILK